MASRHVEDLKALKLWGTWRYMLTQPASLWLLCLYIVIEYVRPQSIWRTIDVLPWGQTSILLCAGALLVSGKKLSLPTVAGSSLVVFSAVLLLSAFTAYRPQLAIDQLELYLVWLLVVFMIVNIVTTEGRFLVFTVVFMLCSFKMSQHGLRSFLTGMENVTGAPGWFFNSGEFGIQMCVFFPLSAAFIWALRDRWPRWKQLVMLILPISALVSVVATHSRGAVVGIGCIVIWWIVAVNRRHRIRSLVSIGVLALAMLVIMPQNSRDRFDTMGDDDTSTNRVQLWKFGIEMANTNPVLGVGYANWSRYYSDNFPRLTEDSIKAHNIFIQVWAELGYTGLLAYLLMIVAMFKVNAKTRRLARATPGDNRFPYAMAFGLDGALVGYMASGFFITVVYYPYFWVNLAMTIALNRAMVAKAREARRASQSVAARMRPARVVREHSPA